MDSFAKRYSDRNVSNKLEYFVRPRNFSRYLYIKVLPLVNFIRSIFQYVDLHRFAKIDLQNEHVAQFQVTEALQHSQTILYT